MNSKKKNVLIINGGIASYKSLDLMRLLMKNNFEIECILTKSVSKFINPITFSALLNKPVHSELFSLEENSKMSHINLIQKIDLVIVIPATANFIGKMANGIADDLASTTILANRSPVFLAPAMNTGMWENAAVKYNIKKLSKRGVRILNPNFGKLACGQLGSGKLIEIESIFNSVKSFFKENINDWLKGKKAIVTSGPSIEKIDPVRYMSNFSSGVQGYEIAKALSEAGAETTLISGPTKIPKPSGIVVKNVFTADDFLKTSIESLPADIFVSVAAIADWKVKNYSSEKLKKKKIKPEISFTENPDILKTISTIHKRPSLVIGFAAETENLVHNAKKKLKKKKCDWIIANDISDGKVFNKEENKVLLLKKKKTIKWPKLKKKNVAKKLVDEISIYFKEKRE